MIEVDHRWVRRMTQFHTGSREPRTQPDLEIRSLWKIEQIETLKKSARQKKKKKSERGNG